MCCLCEKMLGLFLQWNIDAAFENVYKKTMASPYLYFIEEKEGFEKERLCNLIR